MNMHAKPTIVDDEPLQELVLGGPDPDQTEMVEEAESDDCDFDTIGDSRLVLPDGPGFGAIGLAEQDSDEPFDIGDRRNYRRSQPQELSEFERERFFAEIDALGMDSVADDVPEPDVLLPVETAKVTTTSNLCDEGCSSSLSILYPVPQVLFAGLPDGFSVRPDGIYIVQESKEDDDVYVHNAPIKRMAEALNKVQFNLPIPALASIML